MIYPRFRFGISTLLLTAASIFNSPPVLAGEVVPYIGASVRYDSNLFRLSDTVASAQVIGSENKSDTLYIASVGVNALGDFARQRYELALRFDETHFQRFSHLDNQGGNARLVWDWQTVKTLQGRAGYDYVRGLTSFEDVQGTVRDIRTQRRAFGDAGFEIYPGVRFRLGVESDDVLHSAESRRASEHETEIEEAALVFRSRADNTVEGYYRRARVDFVTVADVAGTAVDNDYRGADSGVRLRWRFTGDSTLDTRVAYSDREHVALAQRNFHSWTGRVAHEWRLTGKSQWKTEIWRETTSAEDSSSSYTLGRGISLAPTWQATARIGVRPAWTYRENDYPGGAGTALTGTPARADKIETWRLATDYRWLPRFRMSLQYEHGSRESNLDVFDYDYDSATVGLDFTF